MEYLDNDLMINEPCTHKELHNLYLNLRDEDLEDLSAISDGEEEDFIRHMEGSRRRFAIYVHGEQIGIGAIWDAPGITFLTVSQARQHSPSVGIGMVRAMKTFFTWVRNTESIYGKPVVITVPTSRKKGIALLKRIGCFVDRGQVQGKKVLEITGGID